MLLYHFSLLIFWFLQQTDSQMAGEGSLRMGDSDDEYYGMFVFLFGFYPTNKLAN